jgi:uracil-DNA glycosylase family 4
MKGLFSPDAWQGKEPMPLVPQCGKCNLWQHCKSPKMPVSGNGKRKVLIVAEAPGENEDERGIQLVGNAGGELLRLLGDLRISMRSDCWLDNAIICRPTDGEGQNRKPTSVEIGYCRPHLVKTLNDLQPEVIITLGGPATAAIIPLAWKDGEVEDIGRWVGWQIPSMKLNAWICPTYHPSFLLHEKNAAAELHVRRHLEAAFALQGRPWMDIPNLDKYTTVEFNPDQAAAAIQLMTQGSVPVAFDFETNMLKPDSRAAEILCCSVSDGYTSVAFPWRGAAVQAMRELITSTVPKITANHFELRWCRKFLGTEVRNWQWDTLLGAHWRRFHRGICSVKFQSFVLFGMPDYDSHLEPFKRGEEQGGNVPNRLKEVEPRVLLKYCAYDSLLESWIAKVQKEDGSGVELLCPY